MVMIGVPGSGNLLHGPFGHTCRPAGQVCLLGPEAGGGGLLNCCEAAMQYAAIQPACCLCSCMVDEGGPVCQADINTPLTRVAPNKHRMAAKKTAFILLEGEAGYVCRLWDCLCLCSSIGRI